MTRLPFTSSTGAKGSLSALKKADLAKATEEKLAGTGWLPAILRVS
jgi:hypothetical protein